MPRSRKVVPIPRKYKGSAVIDVRRGPRREQRVLGPWKSKEDRPAAAAFITLASTWQDSKLHIAKGWR